MAIIQIKELYSNQNALFDGEKFQFKDPVKSLKISIQSTPNSLDDCYEAVGLLEASVKKLIPKLVSCDNCGKCCEYAPEISQKELDYFLSKSPSLEKDYKKIVAGKPCSAGGVDRSMCIFPIDLRPLQCRMLFCKVNIIGFERFFNTLAVYLDWQRI